MLGRLAEKEAHLVALENEDLSNLDSDAMKGYVQRHDDFLHSLVTSDTTFIIVTYR